MRRHWSVLGGALVVLLGCSDAAVVEAPERKSASKPKAPPPAAADERGPLPPLHFDFEEALRTRDPFQSFAEDFASEGKRRIRSQREVVLDQYAIADLKLAGLVSRIRPSRAMLIDPTGKGHLVMEGQFVGRAEVVQGGRGADYEVNWRVDRIRESDIVLVREDPTNPDIATATQVIHLRQEDALAVPDRPKG